MLPPLYWAVLANAPARILVRLSLAWPEALFMQESSVLKTLMAPLATNGHVKQFTQHATPEIVMQAKRNEWSHLLEMRYKAAWPLLLAAECSARNEVIEQIAPN